MTEGRRTGPVEGAEAVSVVTEDEATKVDIDVVEERTG